mmetsp:Transcript_2744/g.8064  ORF Transcript_2744/g.8064 Transcript_2744/m.8064 type:complete len:223 (-) Transcript_2744:346-1014(-)
MPRRLEGNQLLGGPADQRNLRLARAQDLRQLVLRWEAAVLDEEAAVCLAQVLQKVIDVYRQPDGPRLVREGASDCLLNPVGGVCAELAALFRVKFLDRIDESQGALLNEVLDVETLVRIFLGDGHHEAQVGSHHGVLCLLIEAQLGLKLPEFHANDLSPLCNGDLAVEHFLLLQPAIFPVEKPPYPARKDDLLLAVKELVPPDGAQVPLHCLRARRDVFGGC